MVVSVETSGTIVRDFKAANPTSGVMLFLCDSGECLHDVFRFIYTPALFWLDGHTDDYTPVLAELAAINSSSLPHAIMIDDWRLFGALPKWPSKEKVIELATNKTRWVYDVDDVLVAMPWAI
jgi:hypothetical protein